MHLPNKTHSRTQSYSVNKAVCVQPRRQAPAQGSLVNGEGNLPCPTLSLHTHFEETRGASFGGAHGTEMPLSIAHAIQGSRNTL